MDPLELIPFQFLPSSARATLREQSTPLEAPPGTVLIRADTPRDDLPVYLLQRGTVAVRKPGSQRDLQRITAPAYFGERGPLFEERQADVVVIEKIAALRVPRATFLSLVETYPRFQVALSNVLKTKQRIFDAFDRFLAELNHGITKGHVVIPRLLHLYRPLHPALHRKVNDAEIDFSGLTYAVRRLPDNLTETFCWFLTWDLPPDLAPHADQLPPVASDARRRTVLELQAGKNLVLLRDGSSDVVDLLTCLCLFAVEARKIRKRFQGPAHLARLLTGDDPLSVLPERDRDGLTALWGEDAARRCRELFFHHEDFAIHVFRAADNYNADHADRWTSQIADATRTVVGHAPHALPEDFEVHIVSSNTHSVTNCLSPWLHEHRDAILAWGATHRPTLVAAPWNDERDLTVALCRDFLAAHPALDRETTDASPGVATLTDTAYTGIEVQLFDFSALVARAYDPAIPRPAGRRGLIVNIDYAFGEQAQHLLSSLIALFGAHIRSINILGKAGGLTGNRGDLVVCTSFVEQLAGAVIQPDTSVDLDALRRQLPDRGVHAGRTLTVAGTLLQNDVLLRFYKRVWGCCGLEMEGAHYAAEIQRAQELGILGQIDQRYLYYISDMPLDHHATLAAQMGRHEGIPPLYAATREVLKHILGPQTA